LVPSAEQASRCGTRFRPPRVLPVGSNLPDARPDRDVSRLAMGIRPAEIVLVSFAASAAGRRQEMICAAARSVVESEHSCVLAVLGIGNAPPVGLPADVRLVHRGHLEDVDVARCLAAGDIFLAPYVDGVSTRRTALMSALQHALPVVGTVGSRSDRVLLESEALVAVPVDATYKFGEATALLASSEQERERRGAAARALFEREFTWDRIVERLLQQLR
ncbi:MAG: glycosyltransferase, partial [Actinomycetota bacterium]|nr:glycosyltransferase [Actinomycetota bacterium]